MPGTNATPATLAAPLAAPLVRVRGLTVEFKVTSLGRATETVHALSGVDLDIQTGEVYGVVGESGSGKTTLARCLLRLLTPTRGRIDFDGTDLSTIKGRTLREWRRQAQVVFQDPVGSLDPRSSVRDIVAEPLGLHLGLKGSEAEKRVIELLDEVGMGRHHLTRRAHELSGGQCQRVAIARALALRPRLLVLDEPTSSLDVSVQAQILNLLGDLRRQHGLTYVLISHDLSVVQYLADRIGVMYLGQLVEQGSAQEIFDANLHPYTRALLSSAPDVDGGTRDRLLVHGDPPSATNPPTGCSFHPRCWLTTQLGSPEECRTTPPPHIDAARDHQSACHFANELTRSNKPEGLPQ
ncbi:MAG: ABC transporter ATP-binding protein [Chloroflexota bacterium]|nr:ABC transporter ATP-binding protein [Chloroflexota bacterium]